MLLILLSSGSSQPQGISAVAAAKPWAPVASQKRGKGTAKRAKWDQTCALHNPEFSPGTKVPLPCALPGDWEECAAATDTHTTHWKLDDSQAFSSCSAPATPPLPLTKRKSTPPTTLLEMRAWDACEDSLSHACAFPVSEPHSNSHEGKETFPRLQVHAGVQSKHAPEWPKRPARPGREGFIQGAGRGGAGLRGRAAEHAPGRRHHRAAHEGIA